jgi:hypothetical protein
MISIFTDKNHRPDSNDLEQSLGESYPLWLMIRDHVFSEYPDAIEKWNFSKNGWSLWIKDKKRAIIYLLPRDGFFKVAFVFGNKATGVVMESNIADAIRRELASAKVYAEGRGIRIEVKDKTIVPDILKLIDIKLVS